MMICITAALSLILAAFPAIALSSTTTYCETVPSLVFKHLPPAEARIRISVAKQRTGAAGGTEAAKWVGEGCAESQWQSRRQTPFPSVLESADPGFAFALSLFPLELNSRAWWFIDNTQDCGVRGRSDQIRDKRRGRWRPWPSSPFSSCGCLRKMLRTPAGLRAEETSPSSSSSSSLCRTAAGLSWGPGCAAAPRPSPAGRAAPSPSSATFPAARRPPGAERHGESRLERGGNPGSGGEVEGGKQRKEGRYRASSPPTSEEEEWEGSSEGTQSHRRAGAEHHPAGSWRAVRCPLPSGGAEPGRRRWELGRRGGGSRHSASRTDVSGVAPECSASPAETCWDRAAPARRLRARQRAAPRLGGAGLGWAIRASERVAHECCGLSTLWQRECGCGSHAESIPVVLKYTDVLLCVKLIYCHS